MDQVPYLIHFYLQLTLYIQIGYVPHPFTILKAKTQAANLAERHRLLSD